MSEHSIPSRKEFGSRDSDPADPTVANLQQPAKLASENCDGAVALNQTLSAQLREAQDRINQLEREADELGEHLLAEARAIIREGQSNADGCVKRTIREADERIERLEAEAKNQISRLQNELAQAKGGTDLVKAEAGKHIESIKMEADARVDAAETEAKKRIDVIRRENEDKVLSLEADLTQAKNRADRAEQWVMRIRREIEEHLMPAMRDAPKPTSSVALRRRSSTVPTPFRSLACIWFRPLWLRITALGCRVGINRESATAFDRAPQHEPGFFSNGLSVGKTGNAAASSEAGAQSGGNSAALISVTAG